MAGRASNEDIRAFISERGVDSFPHVVDSDGTIWSDFGVSGQPAFVFIDHSGSRAVHTGGLGLEELTEVVEQLKIQ